MFREPRELFDQKCSQTFQARTSFGLTISVALCFILGVLKDSSQCFLDLTSLRTHKHKKTNSHEHPHTHICMKVR